MNVSPASAFPIPAPEVTPGPALQEPQPAPAARASTAIENLFAAVDACFGVLSHGKSLVDSGLLITEKDRIRLMVELKQLGQVANQLAKVIETKP